MRIKGEPRTKLNANQVAEKLSSHAMTQKTSSNFERNRAGHFTQNELELLADIVAEKLYQKLKFRPLMQLPISKMTVPEFAAAIQRSPEYVRREIRLQKIPRNAVNGPPYLISPRALPGYDVTPEEAQSRVEQWKRAQGLPTNP